MADKIRVYMIRRNRSVKRLSVAPGSDCFEWNSGLYMLDPESVNLTSKDGMNLNPTPELVFREGDPVPLGYAEPQETPDPEQVPSRDELASERDDDDDEDWDDEDRGDEDRKRALAQFMDPIKWDTSPAGLFLDKLLLGKFIESVTQARNPLIPVLLEYLKKPQLILVLLFAGIIVYTFVAGLF